MKLPLTSNSLYKQKIEKKYITNNIIQLISLTQGLTGYAKKQIKTTFLAITFDKKKKIVCV